MDVEATSQGPLETGADTIAVGLFKDEPAPGDLPIAPLLESGEARGELAALAALHVEERRVITVGLGPRDRFDAERMRVAAAAALGRARELRARRLCWSLPQAEVAAGLAEGTLLRAYRFDRYRPGDRFSGPETLIVSSGDPGVPEAVRRAAIVTTAQNRARDLGNTPANDLTPAAMADYAGGLAGRYPALTLSVLDEADIRAAGMGAFAAVAQGSAADARLIQLDYEGTSEGGNPVLTMVGKGLTFDSGGLWIKPPASMIEMKFDMCGAAAVIEATAALAELEAPVRVRTLVGAAENMPSGNAVKPGDIVRALDGTTIEINNTDAEGRLVLADCLCYARQQGCERIIDLATLTNIDLALGSTYAGLMCNDEALAAEVFGSGQRTGDLVWRMPLHEDYAEMVKGRYAQLTNRSERREAMPLTAAELLHHFAGNTPWAHLDIAGTAWDVPRPYYVGKGATGFGVRLLVELAQRLASSDAD